MTTGIRLGGLSSGLDTEGIVSQLMALERQPRIRIELKQAAAQARKDALADINTKLKALRTATTNLSNAVAWTPTQSVTSSDATRVGARAVGPIVPGTYDVQVSQVARAAERTFAIRNRPNTSALTFTNTATGTQYSIDIPPNSSVDDIVAVINADSSSPVVARNFNGQLLLQAKATGTANAFTATGQALNGELSSVNALDANFTVNGVSYTRSSNTVTDVVNGLELTLSGVASADVEITVGSAGVDGKALAGKVKAFVDAYNAVVDATKSRTTEKRVLNPTTTTDAKKGVLFGDSSLTQMLSQLRNGVMDPLAVGNAATMDELAEIGVSTGNATGGASTPDSVTGKLVFDEAKFLAAFGQDPVSVERLLRGTSSQAGFATRLDNLVKPFTDSGGLMDGRISASTSELTRLGNDLTRMDKRLANKETYLRRQFTSMETMLAQLNAQSSDLASRLPSTNSSNNS